MKKCDWLLITESFSTQIMGCHVSVFSPQDKLEKRGMTLEQTSQHTLMSIAVCSVGVLIYL